MSTAKKFLAFDLGVTMFIVVTSFLPRTPLLERVDVLIGLAILASENYEAKAADLAKRALAADPKLLEAQELLARLALEDNNNAKATEEANKALALNPNSVRTFILEKPVFIDEDNILTLITELFTIATLL